MTTVEHPLGNYRFLPGIAPYSRGVVASPGFEVVHTVFQQPRPYLEGFELITSHLAEVGRPRASLCAIELRSPSPFTFQGFADFNAGYAAILRDWGLFVEGVNPVARTNVAPEVHAPKEPVLRAFSYTRPLASASKSARTFVVAGAGELPEGVLDEPGIIAPGDLTVAGLTTKATFVMDLMEERLRGLGADWTEVTAIDVYTVHPFYRVLTEVLLPRIGPAALAGVNWFFTRPPIVGIEFEMDLRGVREEITL